MPEIGLVGLGRMGLPICANLVRAGYRVLAGDRRPEAARQAAGCGARWAPEVGRLAAGADVLITVLPGPGEVRELMLGTDGAAAALRPGTTWIDMTSNSPAAVTDIRNALLDRGVQVLEAPAGGGVAAARHGSLQLLVGGQAEIVARHRELLEILGSPGRVRHVGGYGAGYTAKLLINLLWFGQAVATAEALLLGRASGLDLGVLREVLADSAAGSDFIRHDLDALFAGDFMRTFALDRCYEELQTVTELARDHHLPFQVSTSVAELYRQALLRYGPANGELLGIALLEEQARLRLRHPPAADRSDAGCQALSGQDCSPNSRPYRMRRRAEQVDQTRQRIVEATVALHGSVGPAATTIAAIAEKAGVTRLTVYRHFPDDDALFGACSAHWISRQQLPDPAAWSQIGDPAARLRAGLADLYRFYRAGADMLTCVYRDFTTLPEAHQQRLRDRDSYFGEVLAAPFGRAEDDHRRLRAVIGHATSFWTWHSLCIDHGLADTEAVDAMTGMVLALTPVPQAEPAQ